MPSCLLDLKVFSAFDSLLSAGKEKLRELGVTTVFDLRSDTEIEKYNTPCPTIEGVEVIRVPVVKLEDYSPEMMAKCVNGGCSGCPASPNPNASDDSQTI